MASAERIANNEKPKVELNTKAIDLDSILIGEVGQVGPYQVRIILLAAVAVCLSACAVNEFTFSAARIPTRCHIPECDLQEPEFTPSWLLHAVPGASLASFDNCQRFSNASAASAQAAGQCPVSWFDRDRLEKCERHIYMNTDTIVYDFDLGCDEWRRSLVGSVVTTGMMVSLAVTGFVSDRWGRKTALVLNAFNTACFGLLRYFSDSYTTFVLLEFAQTTFGGSTFTTAYIMAFEMVGPKYRVAAGVTISTFFATGLVILGSIAYAVPNWRNLTLVLFTPHLLLVSYYWLMPESLRWYISKGRYEDSERNLKKIALINKKQLSEKSLKALREKAEEAKIKQSDLKSQSETEPWLIVIVFRHKRVLLRCIISPIWWMSSTFVYYGLLLNAVSISGNKYFNYMAVAAAQIPGFWTVLLLFDRIGRKPILCGGFLICAVCQVCYMFMPKDHYAISLSLYLIGTGCNAAVMTGLYIYTAELFPTKYRHRLLGFSSTVGRLGSILAPLTPSLGAAVWEQLPFVLFAGCACVSGALVLLTPETRGAPFTDNMDEAEELGEDKV